MKTARDFRMWRRYLINKRRALSKQYGPAYVIACARVALCTSYIVRARKQECE